VSPLGADKTVVLTELKNALRPLVGDKVDGPPAEANIAAIADAIYKVLTADTVVSVDAGTAPDLWTWMGKVQTQLPAVGPPPASITGKLT
jgi:hypothetical protein